MRRSCKCRFKPPHFDVSSIPARALSPRLSSRQPRLCSHTSTEQTKLCCLLHIDCHSSAIAVMTNTAQIGRKG
ncbi:hypothetical protein BU25DRAFT_42044 [Macroventuria anomochaeta]|uniref:Uncharacterized protein n=1 Tax=Macroventuria anomochaeta TaxID=301207 RepID=A0ACB6S3W0_9PLEO|nr:uncharacterized protein BU25DRAFT_42044 [Macroventuria anomochaeta]KAF2628212.1 hypothetical protein BU25DRAFT_42044 [Macroventuria anomochaeta]